MIGGIDIRIKSAAGEELLEVAANALAQLWPNAVFEDGETGEPYDSVWNVPFSEMAEVFVYRDEQSAKIWSKKGAVPEALNSMIHLLRDPGLLTVVVDDLSDEMGEAIDAIKSALADNIHSVCTA